MILAEQLIKSSLKVKPLMFVDGQWVEASDGRTYEVNSPIDTTHLAAVPEATVTDTDHAIDAARQSADKWASKPSVERARFLLEMAHIINEMADDFANVITAENGKTIQSSSGEVKRGVGILTACAEEAKRIYGTVYPSDASMNVQSKTSFERLVFSIREPYGVAVAIPPYSDPLSSTMYKVAPALAAGNTVIVKAPPQTPLTVIFLAFVAQKAGIPDGVLNILTSSGPEPGIHLVSTSKTDVVTFTGSTSTGLEIYRSASTTNKKILLEMSGSDPMIVLEDAELDRAIRDAIRARFHNAGQICAAAKRILVNNRIAHRFIEGFISEARRIVVGNPLKENVTMGPLIDRKSVERIHGYVQRSVAQGARLTLGGSPMDGDDYKSGCYYPPTILQNVESDMDVMKNELFGPVAPIASFEDDDDAIDIANSSVYGLQAAIYTTNIRKALRMSKELVCGGVMINEPPFVRWENIPFGGEKLSGLGRDAAQISINELTRLKVINVYLGE
jgi:acyl-CoA reductase-like NAD-dependent aldehyde dehydrogenase